MTDDPRSATPTGGPRPRRLLVTGGSGFLGGAAADAAQAAGWSVITTVFRSPAGGAPGVVRVDVRDGVAVGELVDEVRPDAVVHTAYVKDGLEARDVIVDGSVHVAGAAARRGARLVHVSTDIVFGGTAGRPYTEDDPPSPASDYGRHKAEAETRVLATAPEAVVVRTSLIYGGPRRPEGGPDRMARDPGAVHYTDELRSPIQVDDLAGALVELCAEARSVAGPLHVAGADGVSRWELACLLAGRAVGGGPAPPGRPLDCRLDSSRARTLLRAPLRGVREVLGERPAPADRP